MEEEFLLIDPTTGQAVPHASDVLRALPSGVDKYIHNELYQVQIELSTPICHDLAELRGWIRHLRSVLADAAKDVGCRLAAVGWAPRAGNAAPLVDNVRYSKMAKELGSLVDGQGMCACHVHVSLADRDLGAQAITYIRPWLPTMQALTVNSPFAEDRDTGYSSWRSIALTRWPTVGPPPSYASAAEYDQAISDLITSGAILDPAMIYWYARLSVSYPTIEVRVGDVCATVEETVLVAALVRALVATAIDHAQQDGPLPKLDDRLLAAAHWRAARDGLEGMAVDPVTGKLVPVWERVAELITLLRPALTRLGDLDEVEDLIGQLRTRGSAASRQREIVKKHGSISSIPAYLFDQTTTGVDDKT